LHTPKYQIRYDYKENLHWKNDEDYPKLLTSFGIIYDSKVKWFEASHEDLVKLKNHVSGKIFLGNI